MDSTAIIRAARTLGLRLTVTKDDGLLCEPASLLTPELREAIKANREQLILDVLLADALRYVLLGCHVEGADPGSVLDAHQGAIDAAYHARDRPAFRSAIREFARSGRREAKRARGLALPSVSPTSPIAMRVAP